MENTFQANGIQKTPGVAKFISRRIDFKLKMVKRDKEGHHIIKCSIHQEVITIHIYALKIGAPNIYKAKINR